MYLFLDDVYTIHRVSILNRADCCGDRTQNLQVGVSMEEPQIGSNLDPDSYPLCGAKQGNPFIMVATITPSSHEKYATYSLVDGSGLQTNFLDPMHKLRSSGYTLSGISNIQIHEFRPLCTPSQKSCFSSLFASHLHQTIAWF